VERAPAHNAVGEAFRSDERFLWGLCYRMSGSAADADDLVQETFARALAHPPPRTDEPLRPWLVRVAMNLSRDHLRRRKRRAYVGPWLPALVDTGDESAVPGHEPAQPLSTEGRYDLLESVSLAFLLALEALTPRQRAVLLLADVFDYSTREIADALDLSQPNVKTTHRRARKAMESYDRARRVPTSEMQERTRNALVRFLTAIAAQDVASVEAQLAEGVISYNDGAGEFQAARLPVVGRGKVALFFTKLNRGEAEVPKGTLRNFNGSPSALLEYSSPEHKGARRVVFSIDLDEQGAIDRIYVVLATEKLSRVTP
jgi:RNA polymerase sigma-70 factor (ECF subfamily)